MSSFNRRTFLFLPLAVAACGFTPVYGPGRAASALRSKVAINAPNSQTSYVLVRSLEERLGRANAPIYRLEVTPSLSQQGQAVTAAGETTRFSIVGKADYKLRRLSDDVIITSGQVDNFTGYSATGSTVETLAAESDARERLMIILANQIATRLYALDLPG